MDVDLSSIIQEIQDLIKQHVEIYHKDQDKLERFMNRFKDLRDWFETLSHKSPVDYEYIYRELKEELEK